MDSFRSENYRRLAEAVRRRIIPGRPYAHLGVVLAKEIAAALEEAADAAPVRRGQWTTTDESIGWCCVCSVCGSCSAMEYEYCPNCGAWMDGGADDGE